jgi:hypothetical protein
MIESRRAGQVQYAWYRSSYRASVSKCDGKRPRGIHRRRWSENTLIYLREIGWKVWTVFILHRIETSDRLLQTRQGALGLHTMLEISLSIWATRGFPRRTQLHGVSNIIQFIFDTRCLKDTNKKGLQYRQSNKQMARQK